MKKLVIENNTWSRCDIEAWLKIHAEIYLATIPDLDTLSIRYWKHKRRAKRIATLVAILTALLFGNVLFGLGLYVKETPGNLLLAFMMPAMMWGVTYLMVADSGKNRKAFDSFRKFLRDWKHLQQLRKGYANVRDDFEKLGKKVGEANRLEDLDTEKKLMKIFRKNHQTLFDFGIITDKDYGVFIPNLRKKEKVETPRPLIGGTF